MLKRINLVKQKEINLKKNVNLKISKRHSGNFWYKVTH